VKVLWSRPNVAMTIDVGDTPRRRRHQGMLTRAASAWLLVGLPVIAARVWWSPTAAIGVSVVGVTVYVAAARRYMHHHDP
jgi:hypothetical protein